MCFLNIENITAPMNSSTFCLIKTAWCQIIKRPREYNKNEKQCKVRIHKYVSPAIQPKWKRHYSIVKPKPRSCFTCQADMHISRTVYGPTWLLGDIQLLTNPALRQKLHVNLTNSLKHEMRSKSNGMLWAKKFILWSIYGLNIVALWCVVTEKQS